MIWRNPLPTLFLIALIGSVLYWYKAEDAQLDSGQVASSLASQMAQPLFGGRQIEIAFTGEPLISLERYNVTDEMLYFSVQSGATRENLYALASDRSAIRFAVNRAGQTKTLTRTDPLRLDQYVYSGIDTEFIGIPLSALNVDADRVLTFDQHGVRFDPTVGELSVMNRRNHWYNGSLFVQQTEHIIFVNHAAFVVKEDRALARLAERLTKGATSQEEKAQRLLDFVTAIEYDPETGYLAKETMRNPHQTIVSNKGDCGNKVILYASLLEQVGIDYQLVYTGVGATLSHIVVAVEGNFQNRNGYAYSYTDGKAFFLAETTATGFQIGSTTVSAPLMQPGNVLLIQEPGRNGRILNAATGVELSYR